VLRFAEITAFSLVVNAKDKSAEGVYPTATYTDRCAARRLEQ